MISKSYSQDWIYRRSDIIKDAAQVGFRSLPFIQSELNQLKPETDYSLFHGLIGNPSQPANLYRTNAEAVWVAPPHSESGTAYVMQMQGTVSEGPVVLRKYAKPGDVLAPTALLLLLDRMMMICDHDENGTLSWSELTCAAPLVISAARGVVTSELVDLDPGVHDGSRVLLEFLSQPGFPQKLAKVVLINGGVKEQKISPQAVSQALSQVKIGWPQIATLIGMPEKSNPIQAQLWVEEAKSRYQACDLDHDNLIRGDAEQKCLTDLLLVQAQKLLTQIANLEGVPEAVAQALYQNLIQSDLIRLTFLFSTVSDSDLDQTLSNFPEMSSGVGKVLQVLEEAIRRSQPLCLDQDC